MADLSPAAAGIAILIAGAFLYGLVWYASRGLSRFAKILARVVPLGLLLPALLYVSLLLSGAPPRMSMRSTPEPMAQGAREEAQRKAPEEEARRRRQVDLEAERKSVEAEAARRRQVELEAERKREEELARRQEAEAAHARKEPPPAAAEPKSAEPVPAPMATPPPAAPEMQRRSVAPEPAPPADWDVVPVFYGTDRVRKDEPKRLVYTSDRARRLELGRALVTVPKLHQVPTIERPFAIRIPYTNVTIYEQAEDPKQHFTVQEIKSLTREEFIALARARVSASNAYKDQAVVFVHGYNTAFDYALYRTAQMAYDLKYDGVALLYSWPSGGGVISYNYDRESSEQAEPYLRAFLELVVKDTGAKSVSVIAHSMGNMPLLRVLQALGPSLPPGVRLNQVILAAPDVDRNLFENLAVNIRQYGRGVTLYCSANDRAMAAARRVAGGIPRAGDVPDDGPLVIAGIDTIDVTQTSTDYLALNHSSYAERGALLNDIGLLLQTGERPPDRRIPILQRVNTANGEFWRYPLAR
jgi:esterase/lipase superfamily enzyme